MPGLWERTKNYFVTTIFGGQQNNNNITAHTNYQSQNNNNITAHTNYQSQNNFTLSNHHQYSKNNQQKKEEEELERKKLENEFKEFEKKIRQLEETNQLISKENEKMLKENTDSSWFSPLSYISFNIFGNTDTPQNSNKSHQFQRNKFPLFFPNKGNIEIEKISSYLEVIDFSNEFENSLLKEKKKFFFGFNHVSSRFEHSFPMEEFIKIREKFPEKEFIIIEFGLGDSKSAVNNPPELSWFKHEKIENGQVKFKVIKFWYDNSFDFTAPQNEDSKRKLNENFRF